MLDKSKHIRPRGGQNYERRALFAEMKKIAATGKWLEPEAVAKKLDADPEDIEQMFLRIRRDGTKPRIACERKQVGTKFQYRLYESEKMISHAELVEKLGPLIDGVIAEGNKNVATISIGAIKRLGALLERQVDEWAK